MPVKNGQTEVDNDAEGTERLWFYLKVTQTSTNRELRSSIVCKKDDGSLSRPILALHIIAQSIYTEAKMC